MKRLIAAAIRCSLVFIVPAAAYAISAQWDLDPISGDWNTAANWTPNRVPNGPSNIARFGLSNTSDVSISANTEVNSIVFTPAATNPYTITASPGLRLTISGLGIVNNSGRTQNFVTLNASGNVGTIVFSHHASAGSNVEIRNQDGGSTNFYDGSTAGNASIVNIFSNDSFDGGSTNFFDHSNAGTAVIAHDGGSTNFFNRSSAGNADIETCCSPAGGIVSFNDNSTAGNAFIGVTEDSRLSFSDNATAAHATIGGGGNISFGGSSTAGNATITSIGYLRFEGNSRGGTAQIELVSLFGEAIIGVLDISDHLAPGVTIGSLAGDEASRIVLLWFWEPTI